MRCSACRRTFGFKKDGDRISIAQAASGIKKRDGSSLDDGTGLSESTVKAALKGLLRGGLIARQPTTRPNAAASQPLPDCNSRPGSAAAPA